MKKLIWLLMIAVFASSISPVVSVAAPQKHSYYGQKSKKTGRSKTVKVKGYYRKNGTYVKPHYRSKPKKR